MELEKIQEKPRKIKDYKIPFGHLHIGIQEKINALRQLRNSRLLRMGATNALAAVSLSPINLGLAAGTGIVAVSAISKNHEVIQATTGLGQALSAQEERFVIRPKHGLEHDWPALKEKYPFAYVKGNGDLVLTARERVLKKFGRMRMNLQK